MAGGLGGDSGALARLKKEPRPRPPRKLRRARSGGLESRDEVGTCSGNAAGLGRDYTVGARHLAQGNNK